MIAGRSARVARLFFSFCSRIGRGNRGHVQPANWSCPALHSLGVYRQTSGQSQGNGEYDGAPQSGAKCLQRERQGQIRYIGTVVLFGCKARPIVRALLRRGEEVKNKSSVSLDDVLAQGRRLGSNQADLAELRRISVSNGVASALVYLLEANRRDHEAARPQVRMGHKVVFRASRRDRNGQIQYPGDYGYRAWPILVPLDDEE